MKKFLQLTIVFAVFACVAGGIATLYWFDPKGSAFPFSPFHALLILLFVCGLTTLNILTRWVKWRYLCRRAGVRVPAKKGLGVYVATLPALLTPFYLGELIRIPLLGQANRLGFSSLLRVFLLERSADVLVLLAMSSLLVPKLFILTVLIGLGLIGFKRMRSAGWVLALGLSVIAWVFPILSLKLILSVFSVEMDWATSCHIFSRGTLFGGVTGIPMGAGVTGSAMLNLLVDQGVRHDLAAWVVLLLRLGTIWFALGVGILCGLLFWGKRRKGRGSHFDTIADHYVDEIPEHVRSYLLERKVEAIARNICPSESPRGLDVGCGQGAYTIAFSKKGFEMAGLDLSMGQLERAELNANNEKVDVKWVQGSAIELPFDDASLDFVYAVNMVHHLPSQDCQRMALSEMKRVLRPGGLVFIHEMNTKNPIFRFYMSYVFPIINAIDEGTEWWLDSRKLPDLLGGHWEPDIHFFTFLPDFIPMWMWKLLHGLERKFEKSRFRSYSAHYMAVWAKSVDVPDG